MQITKDTVARLHYTLKNDEDNIIESSNANEPIAYLQGHGGMIRGVQLALEGKQAGDKFSVSVEPHDGYGERGPADQSRGNRLQPGHFCGRGRPAGQRVVHVHPGSQR